MTSKTSTIPKSRLRAELLEIWKRLLKSNDLTIDDNFFERGDSLLAAEFVSEVKQRLGISIPDSLLFDAPTIRRLAETFVGSPELRSKAVYQVSGKKRQSPLFFFHGDWTHGGFYLKNFARSLGPMQPLVAVAPHGSKGESVPRSLEEMAAERFSQILDFQPRGPFRLGGHCVGGMVALETARLLLASGHDVQMVAMIDPIWTGAGEPWPTLARRADAVNIEQHSKYLPDMTATTESLQQYKQTLATYVPMPLPVPILVFASQFDGRPWHLVSPDFRLFEMPGGHYDFLTIRSNVFAIHLQDQLKRLTDPKARTPSKQRDGLRQQVEALATEYNTLRGRVTALAEERASLRINVAALAAEREDLKGRLAQQNAQIAALNQAVAAQNGELAALRASRSWRITAPLRGTARLLRSH
jgi:acyl carrier protein